MTTNVSLTHTDSTFLNEEARRHLSDRQHRAATVKTGGAIELTKGGAIPFDACGAIAADAYRCDSRSLPRIATVMFDFMNRETELSMRFQRTYSGIATSNLRTRSERDLLPASINGPEAWFHPGNGHVASQFLAGSS